LNLASWSMFSENLEHFSCLIAWIGSRERSIGLCGHGSLTSDHIPNFRQLSVVLVAYIKLQNKVPSQSTRGHSLSTYSYPSHRIHVRRCSTAAAAETEFISVSVDGWMAKSVAGGGNDMILKTCPRIRRIGIYL